MSRMRAVWIAAALLAGAALYVPASLVFPQMLFFPHRATIGETPIYASTPIPAEARALLARADARVRDSAIFDPEALRRPIFLTDGGPRWWFLSLGSSAFAQSRPLGESIVINRSSVAADRVWNGSPVAGSRELTGVIAHERTHVLVRRRFGLFADRLYPTWIVEGYCDHVAGGGTLSDAEAARMRSAGARSRALFYHDSRKRVERVLLDNGGSVDDLFSPASREPT